MAKTMGTQKPDGHSKVYVTYCGVGRKTDEEQYFNPWAAKFLPLMTAIVGLAFILVLLKLQLQGKAQEKFGGFIDGALAIVGLLLLILFAASKKKRTGEKKQPFQDEMNALGFKLKNPASCPILPTRLIDNKLIFDFTDEPWGFNGMHIASFPVPSKMSLTEYVESLTADIKAEKNPEFGRAPNAIRVKDSEMDGTPAKILEYDALTAESEFPYGHIVTTAPDGTKTITPRDHLDLCYKIAVTLKDGKIFLFLFFDEKNEYYSPCMKAPAFYETVRRFEFTDPPEAKP